MACPMPERYRIILHPEAYEGMENAFEYIAQDSPESARKWAAGLMNAINSLDTFPARCPHAPENEFFRQAILQLLYGTGRQVYRILFTITGDAASILHIRHGAQQTLR
jgi:plasmid stabilization system protein ParE